MRLIGRIFKWVGVAFAILILVGVGYQAIASWRDQRLTPPLSEMVNVGGKRIHVVCVGTGPRSFLLDAGLGAWSSEWTRLQPLLAKQGRVCAVDRSGVGWSEDLGGRHDGASVADELAAIVVAARVKKPFVYVGHSLGANFAQIYYAHHPEDVAALVLFEPGQPKDLLEDFHGTRGDAMRAPECGAMCYAGAAAAYAGVVRLAVNLAGAGAKNLSPEAAAQYRAGLARPSTVMASAEYYTALPKTAYQDLDVKRFGVPLVIFASTAPRDPEGSETVADVKVWRAGLIRYFASLAAKSPNGAGPVDVPDSTHASMVMGQSQAEFDAKAIDTFLTRNGVN
jgi:pimeloyl-ACP methyl ester carboxylesterase